MGMYDSIYIDVKCPKCGIIKERECQTKELNCILHNYKVDDNIGTEQFNYLDTITDCNCERDNFFEVRIFIKKGLITNKHKII
jgi:hypothetical protein